MHSHLLKPFILLYLFLSRPSNTCRLNLATNLTHWQYLLLQRKNANKRRLMGQKCDQYWSKNSILANLRQVLSGRVVVEERILSPDRAPYKLSATEIIFCTFSAYTTFSEQVALSSSPIGWGMFVCVTVVLSLRCTERNSFGHRFFECHHE